jgi:hypothetical protein
MKDPFLNASITKDPFLNGSMTKGSFITDQPSTPKAACHPVDLAQPDHTVSRGPMHEAHRGHSREAAAKADGGAPLARCDST